jgi:hypothetical protein
LKSLEEPICLVISRTSLSIKGTITLRSLVEPFTSNSRLKSLKNAILSLAANGIK